MSIKSELYNACDGNCNVEFLKGRGHRRNQYFVYMDDDCNSYDWECEFQEVIDDNDLGINYWDSDHIELYE